MKLSIILLTNNKEVLINVKRKKDPSDNITTLKLSSKKLTDTLNEAISESKNNNVLVINPNDQNILKDNYFDIFRKSNDIIINNLRPDKSPSRKTSIKLNKSKLDKVNVRCNNLCEYITSIVSKNDKVNEADELEEVIEEEETVEEDVIEDPEPMGKKSERFK